MRKKKISRAALLFLAPACLLVGILLLYPVLLSIYSSFTSRNLIKRGAAWVGLENYRRLAADKDMYKAFWISVKWTVLSLSGQVLVGFTAALALKRVRRGQGLYRTLLIIPWAFPSIVIAVAWKWILNGVYGYLPNLMVRLGLCNELPQFLNDSSLVFATLVMINIWFGAPLIMVNILSVMQTIPQDYYEAAQIDGASGWQTLWNITIPHIKVVLGLLLVLRTIWIFNNFDLVYLITGGGPAGLTTTVPIYAYNMGWGLKQLGRASAVTVILLLFLMLICKLYFVILDKWEQEN